MLSFSCMEKAEFSGGTSVGNRKEVKIEKTFNSTQFADEKQEIFVGETVVQKITMGNREENKSDSFTQNVRGEKRKSFDLLKNKEENFSQGITNTKLDIMVVIDNSSSMAEEQENLSTKLNPLLEEVADSDWQIAVVTTDPTDTCLRTLIKKGDANYYSKFRRAVTAGTGGTHIERGLLQAVRGLKGCSSGSWIRDDSALAILIVSDEDNCSVNGSKCAEAIPSVNIPDISSRRLYC